MRFAALKSERGVTSIETTMVFFMLFVLVMFAYEFMKFQSNISLIYINEEIATERIDMALLGSEPGALGTKFLTQLNSTAASGFFNALSYSNVNVECYSSISDSSKGACNSSSKIIKVSYLVKRLFASKWLCDIASLPTSLEREVLTVNDYYQ